MSGEKHATSKYTTFCSPEQHERRYPGVDPETGWRYEYWDIGMTRNASPSNKRWMKVYLDPTPHVVLDQNVPLRGSYQDKHVRKGCRPRPCYTEAIITQPYGGFCPVRCVMCYINNGVRGYRGQGVTVVDPQYPDKIRRQLSKHRWGAAFYISPYTEPFQKLESIYHNSRRTAQVAVDAGLPVFFLTRMEPPGWVYDVLKRNPFSYMQFSIQTPVQDDWRRIAPHAAPLETLYEAIRECRRRGIYVSIQAEPTIPGIITQQHVVQLIWKLAEVGANHLIFKHVEVVASAKEPLLKRFKALFPDGRGEAFQSLLGDCIGNVITIREDYRMESLALYRRECQKAGVTMSCCFEYKYKRDSSGRILDRSGISVGPMFQTSDQCHGRRVPVFVRDPGAEQFRPLTVCDPGGCLYCADRHGGDGNVPCGSVMMARATGHSPRDYEQPIPGTRSQK